MYSYEGAQAIRANIVRTLTLILDNDYDPYKHITREVEALSEYSVCDGQDGCESDDLCTDMDSWPSTQEVGAVVVNYVEEMIEEFSSGILQMILNDILDLHDVMIVEALGDHYYPEDARQALISAGKWSS